MIKNKDIKILLIAIGIAIGIMLTISIAYVILLRCQTYNVFEETVGTRYEKNGVYYIDYNGATYTDLGNSSLYEYKLIPEALGKVNDVFTLHNIEFDSKTATRHGFIIKDPEVIKSLESLAGQVEAWDAN